MFVCVYACVCSHIKYMHNLRLYFLIFCDGNVYIIWDKFFNFHSYFLLQYTFYLVFFLCIIDDLFQL